MCLARDSSRFLSWRPLVVTQNLKELMSEWPLYIFAWIREIINPQTLFFKNYAMIHWIVIHAQSMILFLNSLRKNFQVWGNILIADLARPIFSKSIHSEEDVLKSTKILKLVSQFQSSGLTSINSKENSLIKLLLVRKRSPKPNAR